MLPNDNVSMSVGHLDHVLIVNSSMGSSEGQGQGWREDRTDLLCPLQELLQLICWTDRQEVRSEDQGTQERSGLFHSWYTCRPRARESSVTHKSAIKDHAVEENHVISWDKATVKSTARRRQTMAKRSTLDQEDTDVHEWGCMILPTQPHMGPGDFQVTCSIQL